MEVVQGAGGLEGRGEEQNQLSAGLFPADPFRTHTPPPGISADEVTRQKQQNFAGMLQLAEQFSGASRVLVETAAKLAFDCHFNQFRGGTDPQHYSIHLLEVAKRVDRAFDRLPGDTQELRSIDGEVLTPKAVAIALALVHDTVEDFGTSFRSEPNKLAPEAYQAAAIYRLQTEFQKVVGEAAASRILEYVHALTNHADDEFPGDEYLQGAMSSKYTYAVKLADIDHNLTTFPGFTSVYPSLVAPAVWLNFAQDTGFAASYETSLMRAVQGFDRDEQLPWRKKGSDTKTADTVMESIRENCGLEGLLRIDRYYFDLPARIQSGEVSLSGGESEREQILDGAARIRQMISGYVSQLPADRGPDFKVSNDAAGDVPVRVLGPITSWSGEVTVDCSRDELKRVIKKCADETGQRITGYIMDGDQGELTYRISRLPRRAEQAVPLTDDYRRSLDNLAEYLHQAGIPVKVREEPKAGAPITRALIGLEEGYYDQRRKELLGKIPEPLSTVESAKEAVLDRIGDPTTFGIDLDSISSLSELREALASKSFAKVHSVREVEELLSGSGQIVTAAEIFAVTPNSDPAKSYSYNEPAVVICGPRSEAVPASVAAVADALHQARFSLEHLDRPVTFNVEILEFSANRAAS